ncbi:hypothetical protein FISHEDRAFT_56381 [Fistulina hepatica ATCC 64428]|uniref:CCZ1/INTU/HSP4 first Longin domain-containing protein n=1 Tax=Fistulina hepatica ATCC 64428 TaxID=1128425 RepID=A0A0D7AKU0_9AGAR|nr:hypothetical protein FISHEDRAFT_56381 [Fistulina hepatica ATCC 64428]
MVDGSVAPSLQYLAIYNPTLKPDIPSDDEDVEEQFHILFFTSCERAVSRDRMLRQVGLAKALVNFSSAFSPSSLSSSVHSTSRRMVTFSLEPNFWIHATVELGKSPKPSHMESKASKDKIKSSKDAVPIYEFEDFSVHNAALREDLRRAYELFKLKHGSLQSILDELGHEVLELQLERFFTPWAWSWNIQEPVQFVNQLSPLVHPSHQAVMDILDEFLADFPTPICSLFISPPHIVPSTRYLDRGIPHALAWHLLSLVPEPSPDPPTPPPGARDEAQAATEKEKQPSSSASREASLVPNIANVMDVRKWPWPFGKKPKRVDEASVRDSPPKVAAQDGDDERASSAEGGDDAEVRTVASIALVDRNALDDAISEVIPSFTRRDVSPAPIVTMNEANAIADSTSSHDTTADVAEEACQPASASSSIDSHLAGNSGEVSQPDDQVQSIWSSSPAIELPKPLVTTVYLPTTPDGDGVSTRRCTVHLFMRPRFMLAFLGLDDESFEPGDTESLSSTSGSAASQSHAFTVERRIRSSVDALFDAALSAIDRLQNTNSSTDMPTAAQILQASDRYAISSSRYTIATPSYASHAEHLFYAAHLLRQRTAVEVFSRGQSPQHWFIGRNMGASESDEERTQEGV